MKTFFTDILTVWYSQKKRDLPWRNTKDPYKIWISEIILQQTRIQQGLSYYQRFIEEFISISELAKAPEEKVLKLWQGLGYYSRARNLHFTAKIIQEKFNGNFPDKYCEIITLKGIGCYTAAAIASICFEEAIPVIDGNVFRFISRYLGLEVAYDDSKAKKEIYAFLEKEIVYATPSVFNQALMEMGALVCTPANTKCAECPFNAACKAFHANKVLEIPRSKKTAEISHRYFTYFIFRYQRNDDFCTLIKQRTEKDIWKNLFEFPLLETKNTPSQSELNDFLLKFISDYKEPVILSNHEIKHQLSHQLLHVNFTIITIKPNFLNEYTEIDFNKFNTYAVSVLINKILEKSNLSS